LDYINNEEKRHYEEEYDVLDANEVNTAELEESHIYSTARKLRDTLETYEKAGYTLTITWTAFDVLSHCPHLTEEQAVEVLKYIEKHQDANYGVGWETIEVVAEALFPKLEPWRKL
jgi:hypothetical protein